ncbi:recombinase family protein [Streptomyces kunmingensis]|uniref:Recombinase family protein n=1 Tax=Streptomyces kunmingensis TaxID=68225 RepID=A0ABU6CPU5_9ACTN|nr:recombinase family protein [Streptomyces kunmingensis]MEB3966687.1 recombinase family protein [Streptomyces kunmingensis]
MAEREPSVPLELASGIAHPTKKITPHPWAQRAVEDLRGVPAEAPSVQTALALRGRGHRLVVAYCRVSTDAHKRDGHAARDQTWHCTRIAAAHNLIVVHRYIDNHKSASKPGIWRPDFEEMIDALRRDGTTAGYPVDGIVCVADDRLYRDPYTYERLHSAFVAHGHRVYVDALGIHDLYGAEGASRGAEAALAARSESLKQQQRARMNHRARAERGDPVSVHRPFGWNEDKITLHPGESPVVREGVQSLINGANLSAVTRDFVASGLPTSLGNPWQLQTVKQILRNPRICGYRKLQGELLADSAGVPVLGRWEPIVTPEAWRTAEAMLTGNRHAGGWDRKGLTPGAPGRYLLTGLVRRGAGLPDGSRCGAQMYGAPYGSSHVYRCRTSVDGGCGRTSRQGENVDRQVTEWAIAKLIETGRLGTGQLPWPHERNLQLTRRRRAALEQRWHSQEIPDTEYFESLGALESDIKHLVTARKDWCARLAVHRPQPLGELPTAWQALPQNVKQDMLRGLFAAVVVLPAVKGSHRFDPTRLVPVWRTDA